MKSSLKCFLYVYSLIKNRSNMNIGFPRGSLVTNPPACAGDTSLTLWWKIHQRRKWQPIPVFLPGKSHEQRSLANCSLWDRRESDTTEWLRTRACKKQTLFFTSNILNGISIIFQKWQIFIKDNTNREKVFHYISVTRTQKAKTFYLNEWEHFKDYFSQVILQVSIQRSRSVISNFGLFLMFKKIIDILVIK